MEVRPGYKLTEVGVIPETWELVPIGELFEFKNGLNKSKEFFGQGIPILNYMDVYNNRFVTPQSIQGRVTLSKAEIKAYNVRNGDVFFTRTSETVDEIGITTVMIGDPIDTVFSGFILRGRPKNNLLDLSYRKYCFSTLQVRKGIISSSSYTTRALTNGRLLSAICLLVPPLAEQHAIAAVLSDVDALIKSLDALIVKKRDIKQAAMRELLPGRKRLPNFDGEWTSRTLGQEIEKLEAGTSVNSINEDVGIFPHSERILKTSSVSKGKFRPSESKKIAPGELRRARLSPRADTILISRMNTPDLVGECGYVENDYPQLFLPDRLWMTSFYRKSRIQARWLAYLLSTPEYKAKLQESATGTSGSMKNISKNALFALQILLPSEEEQTAIVAILSDMDAEIAALEQRREKTLQLKQGMMQELLTGRTRLV